MIPRRRQVNLTANIVLPEPPQSRLPLSLALAAGAIIPGLRHGGSFSVAVSVSVAVLPRLRRAETRACSVGQGQVLEGVF